MIRAVALVCFAAGASFAADLTGIWVGQLPGRFPGDVQDLAFRLEQKGGTLAGKQYGDSESRAISEGRIDGQKVGFVITNEMSGGKTKLVFTGEVKDGEIELTRRRELPPDATPEQVKANVPVTFRLKRLL